jgi:hypothetical protein
MQGDAATLPRRRPSGHYRRVERPVCDGVSNGRAIALLPDAFEERETSSR